MFFDTQAEMHTCRMHALHNMAGRRLCASWADFVAHCARYDDMCTALPADQSSAALYFPTLQPTLLGWILREVGGAQVVTTFSSGGVDAKKTRRACGMFLFSAHHVVVAKKVAGSGGWVVLDSLGREPEHLPARQLAAWARCKGIIATEVVHPRVMVDSGCNKRWKHTSCVCRA